MKQPIPIEVKRRAVLSMERGEKSHKIAIELTRQGFPCSDATVRGWRRQLSVTGSDLSPPSVPILGTIDDVARSHLNKAPLNTRILLWDIETLPNQGYFFDTYSDGSIPLPFVKKQKSICTVAYKWLGEENVHVAIAESPYDDRYPCKVISEQMEQADYSVGHYVKGFDIPFVEARLWHNQMPPLAQRKVLDTYLIAKQKFKRSLNSNKLDHLGQLLNLGNKNKTEASLWVRCAEGEKEAIEEMAAYNMQDVVLLEKVFLALRPQFAKQMNIAAHVDEPIKRCRVCASDDIQHIGFEFTANNMRDQYRCNACGAVSTFARKKREAKATNS